ncbi:carboxylesterase/lipase family protein [Sphingomonas sp. AOB5]|uniref:carboxylesterase/lipase family protein n=1 Tax=Sphingomonas sp. AOB5 TaxID=3034017 RepID=UPI0023F87F72|nr:carboxylesterase/lipase family protein [Sphingomonas sp. AOB5]MDF7773995.1 carboxylesterase/lipase family protein [Sphingomonas sp. AOB5]
MKLLLAATAALALALPALAQKAPVVTTAQGKLSGTRTDGVYRFLGIHYGADTSGQNRFRAPKPVAPWTGVRTADKFGDRCPQPKLENPLTIISFSDLPVSEDCLVLNIWSASLKPAAKKPVMVWLHGGGFGFGSASDKYYDGTALAKREGVVVVTLNHRLNGFGYLNLGPEAKGDFDANAGQLDIVAALQWVRDNIARFGGDPGNVTIFGQSGGGGKISSLLAMPAAHGLFHKAIIQSGSDPRIATAEESVATRNQALANVRMKPEDVLKLRELPLADLIRAFGEKAQLLSYRPWVDGSVMPTHPYDPVANPVSANVPLMLGNTRDEGTSVLLADPGWPKTDDAKLTLMATILTGQYAQEAIALYKARSPGDAPMHLLASILSDSMFWANTVALGERKAAQGAPVYMYRIDWQTPVQGNILRAPHGVELPFVFGTTGISEELVGKGPSQDRMTALMMRVWANFARRGNPNGKGIPAWAPYNTTTRTTFLFNDPPSVVHDPDPRIREFWVKAKKK